MQEQFKISDIIINIEPTLEKPQQLILLRFFVFIFGNYDFLFYICSNKNNKSYV